MSSCCYRCTKFWFLQRLRNRAGFPSLFGSIVSAFEFQSVNTRWNQLAQLEAVVEFYANFYNPATNSLVNSVWAAGAKPLDSSDPRYRTVSFQEQNGSSAETLGPNVVHLDGQPDLQTVLVNPANNPPLPGAPAPAPQFPAARTYLYDTLWLEGDTARSSRLYRVMAVDNAAKTVTLDADAPQGPTLSGKSKWTLNRRPVLVMIDPLGRRRATGPAGAPAAATVTLEGQNASVNLPDPDASHRIISLDGGQPLQRVNPNFDTIYLPSDTVQGAQKPWRTYRITAVNAGAQTVTVAGQPVLNNNSSAWRIPAGVSGLMPDFTYALGPGVFDHYDAMVFVVYRGKVTNWFRWTSYTSRNAPAGSQDLSSLAGNDLYYFTNFRSSEPFKNYDLKVTDVSVDDHGIHPSAYDGVGKARFYFQTPIGDDSVPPGGDPVTDAPLGKTLIRMHDGNTSAAGSGSAGCLVSPLIYDLRDVLIRAYQQELLDFCGPGVRDTEIQKAYSVNLPAVVPGVVNPTVRDRSQRLWTITDQHIAPQANWLTDQNWVNKLAGLLWLIRPDEIPLP